MVMHGFGCLHDGEAMGGTWNTIVPYNITCLDGIIRKDGT